MSLLNDMLRDLAHQQHAHPAPGPEAIAPGSTQGLFETSSLARISRSSWWPSLLMFCSIVALLLVAKYYWPKALHDDLSPMSAGAAVAEDLALGSPQLETVDVVSPTKAQLPEPAVDAKTYTVPQTDITTTATEPQAAGQPMPEVELASLRAQQRQINSLLLQAEDAFKRDRLTAPIEDCAYEYLRQVLHLAPDNALAHAGLERIAARYLAMTGLADAQTSWSEAAITRAAKLLKRAAWVAPDYAEIDIYRARLAALAAAVGQPELPSDSTSASVPQLAVEGSESIPAPQIHAAADASAKLADPVEVSAAAHLSVVPNARWQDQQARAQARNLLAQGNTLGAENLLKTFIAQTQAASLSTALLLELYSQQLRREDFTRLLVNAHYLAEIDRHYFEAKQALLEGDEAKALALLEARQDEADTQEDYRALLAGLYQRLGQYPAAATSYRRLLNSFGDKPAYWLGLALALDAQGQDPSALQAFKRVSDYQELEVAVRTYVNQRIQILAAH